MASNENFPPQDESISSTATRADEKVLDKKAPGAKADKKSLDKKAVEKRALDKKTADRKTLDKKGAEKKIPAPTQSALTEKFEEFKDFFLQAKVELKKVTWPTRKETVTTGIAVLVLTFVMSLFLGIADLGLTKIVEFILS